MTKRLDRSALVVEYVPAEDDNVIICRCEEITKGEIRRAVADGMYTIREKRSLPFAGTAAEPGPL